MHHANRHPSHIDRHSRDPSPRRKLACEERLHAVTVIGAGREDLDSEILRWRGAMWCDRCGEGEARQVLRDIPIEAAVVGCGALGDIYACDSQRLLGDLGRTGGGMGYVEVTGDEHELVVLAWKRQRRNKST